MGGKTGIENLESRIRRLRTALKKVAAGDYDEADFAPQPLPTMVWESVAQRALENDEKCKK